MKKAENTSPKIKRRGYRTVHLDLPKRAVPVYTSARTADALEEILEDATLYEGVRLVQVLDAVYEQGRKDGARATFEALDEGVAAAKRAIRHRPPGRPRRPS
jgi:hypothetical protein